MKIPIAILCYITTVLSFPNFRRETQLDEVKSYCDSLVLKTALENKKLTDRKDLDELIRNIPNERTYQTSVLSNGFAYEDNSIGQEIDLESEELLERLLDENDFNKDNFDQLDSEIYISKFKAILSQMRRSCISSILRNTVVSGASDKDLHGESSLSDSSFRGNDLQTVLRGNLLQSGTDKRAKLGLNPTGWRKRRSEDNNDRSDARLQQIVRQLLEKRKRLEFNPTGW